MALKRKYLFFYCFFLQAGIPYPVFSQTIAHSIVLPSIQKNVKSNINIGALHLSPLKHRKKSRK